MIEIREEAFMRRHKSVFIRSSAKDFGDNGSQERAAPFLRSAETLLFMIKSTSASSRAASTKNCASQ
uniref:Uncharacterized protein n=1 Tax=Romanomermis culicivorax TaxID=13658 RepID=A0A915JX82_ROMCU